MAAKPSTVPDWASDTNYSSGPQVGLSTKLAPSSGYRNQGCVPEKSAPGRFMNWLFNLFSIWCAYLDDLHNSADFLNKSYTWLTGVHRFTNGLRAAGISLEGATEVVYTDAAGVAAPKARSTLLHLNEACCDSNNGARWSRAGAGNIYPINTGDGSPVSIRLPQGAVLQSVRAWVVPGASAAISMSVYAVSRDPVTGAIAVGSALGTGGTQVSSGAALQALQAASINATIDNTDTTYEVIFNANSTAGSPEIRLAYAIWTDPGPRND